MRHKGATPAQADDAPGGPHEGSGTLKARVVVVAGVLVLATLGGGAFLLSRTAQDNPLGRVLSPQQPQGAAPVLAREVVFIEQPDPAKAIEMLEAGQMHVYASGLTDPELERRVRGSRALDLAISYGSSTELTFNPVGPVFPGTEKLNPFHVPAIREAMNWLVDRNHIAQEIYGGLGKPRYLPLTSSFPDYARLADVARALEIQYAPNVGRARAVVAQEMEKLGAVQVGGVWQYRGRPVELAFLIRSEDERREIGDYVATLLQGLGFAVDRQYRTAAESSRIWIGSDPAEGTWHLYTGGWVSTAISRDQAGNFSFYYTARGRPEPLWQAYRPAPELDRAADALARRDYATLEERQRLMAEALRLSMADAVRVWLADRVSAWATRSEVAVTADLAGGISGSALWPYTLRFNDGRTERVTFGSPGILTEPWNPLAGTNWIFDQMIIRGTIESPVLPDPFTGLSWPLRIKSAEVFVEEGLPVTKTHDWVDLTFVPSIQVPGDAWIDWDPVAQRFITAAEAHPQGLSARTRTVVHYVDDLYQRRWHDGTRVSLADALVELILTFDRAKEGSPLYDEAEVPAFETFAGHFRGVRILQEDPLVAEIYDDQIFPDAELMSRAGFFYAGVPWHKLAIGMLAETNRELAFSNSKADRLRVEWMSYIAGPSLTVLERYRVQAQERGYIPYENVLGRYVTREDVARRYEALGRWYRERGHFWVGQGPFYVYSVHPVEKSVVVRRAEDHLTTDERWLAFTRPRIAEVEVSGPSRTARGARAEFSVKVTSQGQPYPMKDVELVKFLVFDAQGRMAFTQDAEAVHDGEWRAVLSPDQSAQLEVGANRLEAIVVSRSVSIPSFDSFTFVTQ